MFGLEILFVGVFCTDHVDVVTGGAIPNCLRKNDKVTITIKVQTLLVDPYTQATIKQQRKAGAKRNTGEKERRFGTYVCTY